MKTSKCGCIQGFCLFEYIYPDSDTGTYACDEKCYFDTKDGQKSLNWYIDSYPKEYKKFKKNIDIHLRNRKIEKIIKK